MMILSFRFGYFRHVYCSILDKVIQMTEFRQKIKGNTMHKHVQIFCFLCLGLLVTNTSAAEYQSLDSIYDAAQRFMQKHVESTYKQNAEINSGRLDSRLKLNRCGLPLEVYLPEGGRDLGRITVGVKCTDNKPWSLHVPVTVTIYKDVIVTAKSLPRGTLLTEKDLVYTRYDMSKLPAGYIEQRSAGVGMQLKRRLSAGDPLTTSLIKKPLIIKRGQGVSIVASSGGIEVRMSGKALAHGAAGERIRVLNLKSKIKIEGTVMPSGEIRVDI